MPTPPRHAAPARRSAWRPLAAAAAGLAVLVIGGQGVFAALSATASSAPQAATAGTLSLTLAPNGAGFTQPVAALAPGDTVHRYVDLTNGGSLAGAGLTVAVASTGSVVLRTDTTRGLRVTVTSCSTAWTPSTGACTGGATTPLVSSALLGSLSTPAPLAATVPAGQVLRLQVSLRLPDQDETTVNGAPPAGTVQGQSASLTWTFSETQRTATTTSS